LTTALIGVLSEGTRSVLEFELLPDPFKRPSRQARGLEPARVWRLGWLAAICLAAGATAFLPQTIGWAIWTAFIAGAAPAFSPCRCPEIACATTTACSPCCWWCGRWADLPRPS
jgi:hypothetical protein